MRSSGRMALVVSVALMIAAAAAGGCKHQTPEQKAQAKLAKQQQSEAKAQAKAQQKQAKAQAKAQADATKAQEQAAKKQAEADRKAAAQAQKQADAQAKADKKAAEEKAAQDKHNAELAAKEQKKAAKHPPAEAPMNADTAARAHDIEPVGPTVNYDPADAMTLAAHQGYGHYPDDQKKVIGYPYFNPENRQRLFDQHAQTMSAEGQAEDATLSDADFDGGELNATGRSNLALALQAARANNKHMLYVGTPSANDELKGDRAAAVERYIKASPWSSIAVTTRQGLNASNTTSVIAGSNALKRLDKETGGPGGDSNGGGRTARTGSPSVGQ